MKEDLTMKEKVFLLVVSVAVSFYIATVISIAFMMSAYSKKSVWNEVENSMVFIKKKTFGVKDDGVLEDSVINKRSFE